MNTAFRTVRVTEEHIIKGERRSVICCPVALALKETFPELSSVHVYKYITRVSDGTNCKHIPLLPSITGWISRFDSGKSVDPFQFEVRI